jgi:hypothetical protein
VTEFLVTKGIRKGYPGVVALAGVDFDLRESEVRVIVGETPSGLPQRSWADRRAQRRPDGEHPTAGGGAGGDTIGAALEKPPSRRFP